LPAIPVTASDAETPIPVPQGTVIPSAVSPPVRVPAAAVDPAPVDRFTWDAIKPRVIVALPGLWLIGAPLTALFVGLGWTGAARLRRQSTALIDDALLARFARCRSILRVKNVGLAVCDRIAAPIVVGILRPMILLPPALLTSLTCEQWEMILLHELAHVRRLDNLVNLLQRGVETVLFFHPAVWWVSRWMRLEREHCCDAVVLQLGTSPQSYAETLAVLALPGIAPQLATAAMANHELLTRMRHILGTEDLPMTVSWKKLGLGLVMFAAVSGLVANDWWNSSHRAAAEEGRQKELEERIRKRVLLDLKGDRLELIESDRQETGADRARSLQAAIEQIEKLRSEFPVPSPKEGGHVVRFSNQLIERLKRLQKEESDERGEQPLFPTVFPTGSGPRLDLINSSPGWSAEQAIGPPDVPDHRDHPNAWAARVPDHGEEWLQVNFTGGFRTAAVVIHESFNPGAIKRVEIISDGDDSAVTEVYSTTSPIIGKHVTVVRPRGFTFVKSVRIVIDEPKVPGWNEIDAVGLINAETGETHWATSATASSSFADTVLRQGGPVIADFPVSPSSGIPSWHPRQAIGKPDVPEGKDDGRAWASATQDGQPEWLDLTFDPPVPSNLLMVHESYRPGALVEVQIQTVEVNSIENRGHQYRATVYSDWKSVWTGRDPVQEVNGKGVAAIPIPAGQGAITKVRLKLDSPAVAGWNEIDAVGLLNSETGQVQWACEATASSWYGEPNAAVGTGGSIRTIPALGEARFVDVLEESPLSAPTGPPAWHPDQATGAPNVAEPGDNPKAWASATPDGNLETLQLTYDPPVDASLLLVHQSFNPGALVRVLVEMDDTRSQEEMVGPKNPNFGRGRNWRLLWNRNRAASAIDESSVATIPVPPETRKLGKIAKVLLMLDSASVPGRNEIDAVGLLSTKGEMHWAKEAKASSWYGEGEVTDAGSSGSPKPDPGTSGEVAVGRLEHNAGSQNEPGPVGESGAARATLRIDLNAYGVPMVEEKNARPGEALREAHGTPEVARPSGADQGVVGVPLSGCAGCSGCLQEHGRHAV